MRRAVWTGLAAVILGLGPLIVAPAAGAATPPSTIEGQYVEGQILAKFRDDRASAGVLRQYGLSAGPSIGSTGARLITVPAGRELRLIEALGNNPAVEYAEPDAIATVTADPPVNDQYFSRQYALQNDAQSFTNTAGTITVAAGTKDADVDAVEAWAVTTGGGTRVAVLDTGVAGDNEDITPKVVASWNFTSSGGESDTEDWYGHGTHVAGIIAATANNRVGVAGVCPGCSILDGKVLNDNGSGSASAIAQGIDWAVKNGAKVINMSLGMRLSTRTLEEAVNNAWNQKEGAVIVAAAGNTGAQSKIYPGAYPNVIAVAATDNKDAKASFSTYGAKWVDVAAPGVSVYSTFPNHHFALDSSRSWGYDIASGTSMASPIVAATAALAWDAHPSLTNASVRARLESTADPIKGTGTYWAHGRVNAFEAVK